MARKGIEDVCGMCGDGRHHDRIFLCKKFKGLKFYKKAAVKKLGACRKCLGLHDDDGYCRDIYRNKVCNKKNTSDHHNFLCPVGGNKKFSSEDGRKGSGGKSKLTEEQEGFLSELTPEMAERCRNAFINTSARINT